MKCFCIYKFLVNNFFELENFNKMGNKQWQISCLTEKKDWNLVKPALH